MAAGGVLVGRGYVSIRPEFEGDWSRSVSSRASSAGRSGAGAFSKAFGVGLRGIGALAGVAIAANLSSAAAGAAALAPALTTAGAAAGALKLGLSGVGEAFKAAFADSSAQASSAASATRAVESAQRGLANAQRALADAREDAAKRVREAQRAVGEAEQNLARVVEDSAQRQRDAQQSVRDAERDLRDAQRDAREAQTSLTDARIEATRALQDMNQRLSESRLDEREAVLRLKEAEKELRAAQANPGVTPDQLEKLRIQYERAKLNLQEQREETKRLSADTAKANKAGINGSEQMQRARERVAAANETVADRERGLAKAQEEARRTGVEAARDIADAQLALADAQAGVDEARAEGQRQIEDAQRAVADAAAAVADAQAAAAAQTSKFDEAMSKLAPNAQSFVKAVQGLAPAWDAMRLSVQNELFKGLDSTVTTLGRSTIPVLQRQLTATAGVWNAMAKNAAGAINEMARTGMLDKILAGATDNLRAFEKAPGQIITAWGQLTLAAQPAFNALLQQMAGAIKSFTDGIAASFESGGLEQAITTAFQILSQFGTLLGNVLGVVQQIFKAASDAGGQIVGTLGAVFGELERILAAPQMQAQMRSLFASVAQIVGAIVPVIGAVVQAVVPLMAAIAAPIAQLATALGPVLQVLATTLAAALTPILQALMPVIVQVGTALIQIVQAVTPLLQPIADLIAAVVNALAPALTPVIALITGVVQALVGPLTSVVRALAPILTQVAQLITQVFLQLMTAIEPLIPIALQLVQEVFGALQPMLPAVATAFGAISTAAMALLPPIAQIATVLAKALVPIIADLAPVVAELGSLFSGLLAQALPPLTGAVLTLFTALQPLWPLIGQLVAQVVSLASGLLVQLMPSFVQLALAIVPIIPSLAEILALVIQLAVDVLSHLLPPLTQLAGFLAGKLAGALKVAIGWMTQIVRWISNIVSWVADKLGPIFEWISDVITGVIDGIVWAFRKLYDILIGHSILPDIVAYIVGPFAAVFRWLNEKIVQPVWRAIREAIRFAWEQVIRPQFTAFKGGLRGVGDVLRWLRDNVVKPVWDAISGKIRTVWREGIRPAFDALKGAIRKVGDAFETAKNAIKTAWDKIKKATKDPINFVLNTVWNKGIVKAWDKILGWIPGLPKLKALPLLERGGTVPAQPGVFNKPTAIVGEGRSQWPEFVIPTDPKYRSRALSLWEAAGGRLMEDGGILGSIVGGIKSIGSKVGGFFSSAASFLKNPGKALDKLMGGLLKPLQAIKNSAWGKMAFAIPKAILKGLKDLVTGGGAAIAGVGPGPGSGVTRWRGVVRQALGLVGQPLSYDGITLRRMNQESGGNPNIVNRWDSNWQAGHPSVGLMQVIGPTFRSYAGRFRNKGPFSYGVSVDPLANVYASMKYALAAYGSLPRAYNRAGGYDAGGWLQPGVTTAVNATGKPEAVLTDWQWRTMTAAAANDSLDGMTVNVWVGNQQIRDITRAEVRDSQQQLVAVLNAS